jgi:hypothetical protein
MGKYLHIRNRVVDELDDVRNIDKDYLVQKLLLHGVRCSKDLTTKGEFDFWNVEFYLDDGDFSESSSNKDIILQVRRELSNQSVLELRYDSDSSNTEDCSLFLMHQPHNIFLKERFDYYELSFKVFHRDPIFLSYNDRGRAHEALELLKERGQ